MGTSGARDPVHIQWAPSDPPLELRAGGTTFGIMDERYLDLEADHFGINHELHLRVCVGEPEPWEDLACRLGLFAALLEFLADRPMPVTRQWRPMPALAEGAAVDHLFRPVVGVAPDDPDHVWLTLGVTTDRLEDALGAWCHLHTSSEGLLDLVIEEVRFRRGSSVIDRILRLSRILELLHRRRHPAAEPEDDDDAANVAAVLEAAPEGTEGWLRDRLGVSLIRLRQRLHELLADLGGGLDEVVVDPDRFARAVTKTRNWHTHYGDPSGVLVGDHAAYLAIRLWLVVRASMLLELGWTAEHVAELVRQDQTTGWIADRPLEP